jgi:tetratricopeptide (TPR) repeat protein
VSAEEPPIYLDGLPPDQASTLRAVNGPGVIALHRYLTTGEALAFLGAGVSVPLYPLWASVIGELIDAAVVQGLGEAPAQTCRDRAAAQPDAVVDVLRRHLGEARYRVALRETFRVRRDPESGRTWTPVQELVCRCGFRAVVTTNYDPGIVDARMRVRPRASGTGFTSWTDELALDRWRTGDVFGDEELPVLFAHGHHNQPEAMVLATTEYRRAYAGKLAAVLERMVDAGHLVWIGFSFADQRIDAILHEVAEHAGSSINPSMEPRHVAIMPWDPDTGGDPDTLRRLAEISYGADLVLYPAPGHDHTALTRLLATLTDPRIPPAPPPDPAPTTLGRRTDHALVPPDTPEIGEMAAPGVVVRWVPGVERVSSFTGRVEELARLDRWAGDPTVRLVGVTAWGGAGKTALVTHWIEQTGGASRRPGIRGVFGWSFYADPSPDHWAEALLDWVAEQFGVRLFAPGGWVSAAAAVLAVARQLPLVLVLDGLEVAQEGPTSDAYGRLLDGTLREVLTGLARLEHGSLVVLTSRFPFADLTGFDGTSARMLEVPPFTLTEGAALLAVAAPDTALTDSQRRELVGQVDGHALAVTAIAALLVKHPETSVADLPAALAEPGGTQDKVSRVLAFYSQQLTEPDRYLVAAVALFARPVTPAQVLTVADHDVFAGRLEGWDPADVQAAVRGRLSGLLTWHPDGTITAHPLVRQTFRPLALGAAQIAADTALADTPTGTVTDRTQAQRVVEAIELLLDADQWQPADDLYATRIPTKTNKSVWTTLPAARLGQRAATAFVATPDRRDRCRTQLNSDRLGHYLTTAGLFAMHAGDLATAREYLDAAIRHDREAYDWQSLSFVQQNLTGCLGRLGHTRAAAAAAAEALTHADNREDMIAAHSSIGWAAGLAGGTAAAEHEFLAADRINYHDDGDHLSTLWGVMWGWFLARTGRPGPARRLTTRNLASSQKNGWSADVAWCRGVLARLDLADHDLAAAGEHLAAALRIFRDGDYLVELADVLTVAADQARRTGQLETAADHVAEALEIAAPRGLTPTHADALTVRAHIAADQHTATRDPQHLYVGRDAADAALRLATGAHALPWRELAALYAHAHLDDTEGTNRGWTGRATDLHHRLVPDGLDPDPLTTIENETNTEPEEPNPPGL